MADTLEFGPVAEEDLDDYADLVGRCFDRSGDEERRRAGVRRFDRDSLRTLRENGRPVGALCSLSMGQYFGGRAVPCQGVAAVGIEPHRRGAGLGLHLMREGLHEAHRQGLAISTLYPSTNTLYRRAGFERAGGHYRASVRPLELGRLDPAEGVELVPLEGEHEDRAAELWAEWARSHAGNLERNEFLHRRARVRGDRTADGYLVRSAEGAEGYIRWLRVSSDSGLQDLEVTDLCALTPRAVRRLLRLFGDHRSLVGTVRWPSAPTDPLLALLPERFFQVELREVWMVRLVNVAAALEARGYPPGLEAELDLEVQDELCEWNRGPLRLALAEGRATVEPGGSGALKIGVRALAPLFTGHLGPRALARLGWLEAPERELTRAEAIFAGPAPWMADSF